MTWEHVHERHQPRNESVTSPLENVEERGQERGAENKGKSPSFEEVNDEKGGCGLVEPVFFFQYKGAVNRQWERGDRWHKEQDEDKADRLEDLSESKSEVLLVFSLRKDIKIPHIQDHTQTAKANFPRRPTTTHKTQSGALQSQYIV